MKSMRRLEGRTTCRVGPQPVGSDELRKATAPRIDFYLSAMVRCVTEVRYPIPPCALTGTREFATCPAQTTQILTLPLAPH